MTLEVIDLLRVEHMPIAPQKRVTNELHWYPGYSFKVMDTMPSYWQSTSYRIIPVLWSVEK
jgi:hypothetical protein